MYPKKGCATIIKMMSKFIPARFLMLISIYDLWKFLCALRHTQKFYFSGKPDTTVPQSVNSEMIYPTVPLTYHQALVMLIVRPSKSRAMHYDAITMVLKINAINPDIIKMPASSIVYSFLSSDLSLGPIILIASRHLSGNTINENGRREKIMIKAEK